VVGVVVAGFFPDGLSRVQLQLLFFYVLHQGGRLVLALGGSGVVCDRRVALGFDSHGQFLSGLFLLQLHLPFDGVGRGVGIGLAALRSGVVGEADVVRQMMAVL
jgi:hypothetical protein